MYVLNNFNIGKSTSYSDYKNNNPLYPNDCNASYLLTNRDISIFDIYKPNTVSDISFLINSNTEQFYILSKYIYDESNNPNGCIKLDANTRSLVNQQDNTEHLMIHISDNKVLSSDTFNANKNTIILIPNNYYMYMCNYKLHTIGSKPSNIQIEGNTNTSYRNWIIGNISNDICNKIFTNSLTNEVIASIPDNVSISRDNSRAITRIYFFVNVNNFTEVICKVNTSITRLNKANKYPIQYIDINLTNNTTIELLNQEDPLKTINITLE